MTYRGNFTFSQMDYSNYFEEEWEFSSLKNIFFL